MSRKKTRTSNIWNEMTVEQKATAIVKGTVREADKKKMLNDYMSSKILASTVQAIKEGFPRPNSKKAIAARLAYARPLPEGERMNKQEAIVRNQQKAGMEKRQTYPAMKKVLSAIHNPNKAKSNTAANYENEPRDTRVKLFKYYETPAHSLKVEGMGGKLILRRNHMGRRILYRLYRKANKRLQMEFFRAFNNIFKEHGNSIYYHEIISPDDDDEGKNDQYDDVVDEELRSSEVRRIANMTYFRLKAGDNLGLSEDVAFNLKNVLYEVLSGIK